MEKPKSYYCTMHRKYFYEAVRTQKYIKLNCYSNTFFLKQLQFSVEFFNDLLKDKKIILQN
jgi:hypothetical protein